MMMYKKVSKRHVKGDEKGETMNRLYHVYVHLTLEGSLTQSYGETGLE